MTDVQKTLNEYVLLYLEKGEPYSIVTYRISLKEDGTRTTAKVTISNDGNHSVTFEDNINIDPKSEQKLIQDAFFQIYES
ncbi:hypothetical protein [Peribacillus butanolivorans]|uniref:hypothetical protein n=1 Tax=Peribacillus butanolivorans TaxID=421767 RepID=UPI00366E83A6